MNYIIIDISHGTGEEPMFWRANDSGYTTSPFAAGIYTEEQVKARPDYYNDGYNTVAIPLTDGAMASIGFTCSFDEDLIMRFYQKSKVKPAAKEQLINSMNNNFDPKDPQEEAPQEQAPDTQATEEKATEAKEGQGALVD